MEKCYDYYSCKKTNCIMFKLDANNINCWDIEGTLCNHPYIEKLDIDRCKLCLYYKSVNLN